MAKDFGFVPYVGEEPFIFISYKSEESDIAARYAKHLHDSGINVYYDNALKPAEDWAKTLLDTIGQSNCMGVILIASRRSLASKPVEDEVKKAHYSHKIVLGVYIENVGKIEEPMSTFLSGTHSVLAWQLSEEQAKEQVLVGAAGMIAGNKKPKAAATGADEMYNTAQFFMTNYWRSGNSKDMAEAQKNYRLMTEQAPTDYRGWLGLAMLECMGEVKTPDDALLRLNEAARYYSYVVSAGADNIASGEYTNAKNELWGRILTVLDAGLKDCGSYESAKKFRDSALLLDNRFGHTAPDIAQSYKEIISSMNAEWDKITEEHKEAETAKLFEWEFTSESEAELKGVKHGAELPTELIIPERVNGRYVRSIGNSALKGCRKLTSVTIPDSVTSIGYSAFRNCSGLTSVTIPDSVTSIGDDAFARCSGLTSATIPDSVTSIGDSAFRNCSGLTSVTIPDSVTSIGGDAFARCSGLTSVTIPSSVTSIGSCAFSSCSGLTSLTIPRSVESIGYYAFSGCTKLTSIIISQVGRGDTYRSWLNNVFGDDQKISSVTILDGAKSIGDYAFAYCSGLTSITIPDSVTRIGDRAFRNCSGLTSVTIPGSVVSISSYAFCDCSGLTSVTIPSSVTSIGSCAFAYCSGLTSITIPRSVESIGYHALYGCSALVSVTIPWVNSGAENCSWLNEVFGDDQKISSVTILDGAKNIGKYAFYGCKELNSVTIPDSVTSIGSYAFKGCSGLTSVTIPDGVTSIGSWAFEDCKNLTIYGSGGMFSYVKKYAKKNGIKYKKIK